MKPLKIGIVEDELLIAESITITLQQIGYNTTQPVRNYADALIMIKSENPDLLLIDIMLDGDLDGIDLAAAINKEFDLPFIFLTANSDPATVNRAKEVKPYAYLIKPFNENELFSSIEIAISNYNDNKAAQLPAQKISIPKDFIFVKDGERFHKVTLSEILYMESDNVYLIIYTAQKKLVIRAKLEEFIAVFTAGVFIRTHRSYAINLNHLETVNNHDVIVSGMKVPLHKNYKPELEKVVHFYK